VQYRAQAAGREKPDGRSQPEEAPDGKIAGQKKPPDEKNAGRKKRRTERTPEWKGGMKVWEAGGHGNEWMG